MINEFCHFALEIACPGCILSAICWRSSSWIWQITILWYYLWDYDYRQYCIVNIGLSSNGTVYSAEYSPGQQVSCKIHTKYMHSIDEGYLSPTHNKCSWMGWCPWIYRSDAQYFTFNIWVLCSQIRLSYKCLNWTNLEYIPLHSRICVKSFPLNARSSISEQANNANLVIGKTIKNLNLINTNGYNYGY
jgi:hypothetical protein